MKDMLCQLAVGLVLVMAIAMAGCSDDFAAPAGAHGPVNEAASSKTQKGDNSTPGDEAIRRPLPDGHSSASWHQLREVDQQIQLIVAAPTSSNQAFEFNGLTVWPIKQLQEPERPEIADRRADYPARFASGDDPQSDLPKRPGAIAPSAAMREAENWIRRVIKDEYVPVTLASRLHALPHVRPEHSTIWVRYEMGGVAVQIGQTRGAMVVVLRSTTYVGERTAEFGREAFRRFFADQALARAEMQPATSSSADLAMFTIGGRGQSWFDRARWYTDGQAMAIWLPKRLPGHQAVSPDTPWF